MQLRALLATWMVTWLLALSACSKSSAPEKPPRAQIAWAGRTWEVLDGNWHLEGDVLVGSSGHVLAKKDVADGTLELDIEQAPSKTAVSGAGNTIGIGFRYVLTYDDPSRANGYTLNLQIPTFTVVRGANSYFQPVMPDLRGFQRSGLFDPRKNHVAIHMNGKRFRIDINGDSLVSFDEPGFAHGGLELWAESTTDPVRFSNLRGP